MESDLPQPERPADIDIVSIANFSVKAHLRSISSLQEEQLAKDC
jgi:hypothetical protein